MQRSQDSRIWRKPRHHAEEWQRTESVREQNQQHGESKSIAERKARQEQLRR